MEGVGKATNLSPSSTNERTVSGGRKRVDGPGRHRVGRARKPGQSLGVSSHGLHSWALSRLDRWGDCVSGGSPPCLLEETGLLKPGMGKPWLEPEGVALSQTLQEDLCRVADFLQLFYGACGLKGEVWLHLESCPQRGMAGVGVGVGRVVSLWSWRGEVDDLGEVPAGA